MHSDEGRFKAAVLERVLPKWQAMPEVQSVRLSFEHQRDNGAPPYPMVVGIDYLTIEAMESALASKERAATKLAMDQVLDQYFDGTLHHHVMHSFQADPAMPAVAIG